MLKTRKLADILAPIRPQLHELETALSIQLPGRFSLLTSLRESLARQRGKRLRPSLVFLSGASAGSTAEGHLRVAILTELLHAASLIHDDIIDASDMRRNQPSLQNQWGSSIAVVFGDLLFSVSFGLTETFQDASVRRSIVEATQAMCEGELLQHEFHKLGRIPSTQEYLEMVRLKTAALLSACCRAGAILAGAEPAQVKALARYGEELGIAFQVVDDCLDLAGEEGKMGKSLGTDVSTGKLTLPVILLLAIDCPQREELRTLLAERGNNLTRRRIVALLESQGTLEAAYRQAARHAAGAQQMLAVLPAGPCRDSLHDLAEYVLSREQ